MRVREENEEAASAAAAAFEKQASDAGVAASARAVTSTISAGYDLFGSIARRFDLAVVGQDDPENEQSEGLIAEGALFESGRPLIMVPYIHKEGFKLDRVMVCWDGGRPAARRPAAVGDPPPRAARRPHPRRRGRSHQPEGDRPHAREARPSRRRRGRRPRASRNA